MSFDRLLKDGKIKPFRATKEEIERSIELADRDGVSAIFERDSGRGF